MVSLTSLRTKAYQWTQQLAIKFTQKLHNETVNSYTIIKSKNTHLPEAERY